MPFLAVLLESCHWQLVMFMHRMARFIVQYRHLAFTLLVISWILCVYYVFYQWNLFPGRLGRRNKYNDRIRYIYTDINIGNDCLRENFSPSIEKFLYNVNLLQNSSNIKCKHLYGTITSLYDFHLYMAPQKLGQEFSMKMKAWLRNDNILLKAAESQQVLLIHDIYNQRTTVYNPLRSKRPVSDSQKSQKTYLQNLSKSSRLHCDFCSPFNMTAEDVFGRIEGKYSVSASNAFKLHKWHGLFIPYEHSIFDINEQIFLDVFNTSLKWFKKTRSIDESAQYPVLFWDMFPHAGASQMHVHIHGLTGIGHYPGQFQDIGDVVEKYYKSTNENYWHTVIKVHNTLGLTLSYREVTALAPLVPRREHEIVLLSEQPSTDLFMLLYTIIQMYQNDFGRYCFSMAGALPVLESSHNNTFSLPVIIFIGTRGDCSSPVNDISSLELYLFNNVNSDPYDTISNLQKHIDKLNLKRQHHSKMVNLWSDTE